MRHALTALLSAAAIGAFAYATPAAAQSTGGGGGDANAEADQAQLHPWQADMSPRWAPNGVSEGEVYSAGQAYGYGYHGTGAIRPWKSGTVGPTGAPVAPAPAYQYGYGYGPGGPVGAAIAAPFNAAGALVAAPFAAVSAPFAGSAPTIPSRVGAPLYAYHHTGPRPGVVGSCSIIAGNRVCTSVP